jgi:protocatechuate 3,4-dioxygenase alpha subunit
MSLVPTASQTVGPFIAIGVEPVRIENVAPPGVNGERITLKGRVLDGDGQPVTDALVETWQANSHGKYAHPDDVQEKLLEDNFKGLGRVLTNNDGAFRLTTIKPGGVPGPDGTVQAPHMVVIVFMRGLLKHLVTRVYFPDEPANADDPVLKLVPAARHATLIAKKSAAERGVLEWNVVLQGKDETVFFDY